MRFALTDFFQDGVFRVFSFVEMPRGNGHGQYWMKADMNLARTHGISLQELPLLCRISLEERVLDKETHTFTYTVEEMKLHATARAASRENRGRKPFAPGVKKAGAAQR